MRIVGGIYKGRSIAALDGRHTRPTTDRVREAIASMLISARGSLAGASVLDAFAGSGALGLEALSRGARAATFYEKDRRAASVVKANMVSLEAQQRGSLVVRDIYKASSFAMPGAPFDVVFLDPPYATPYTDIKTLLEHLIGAGQLTEGAYVIFEHGTQGASPHRLQGSGEEDFEAFPGSIRVVAQKTYGTVAVHMGRYSKLEEATV